MNTSLPRVLVALVALTFVVVACAGNSGAAWTFAPLAVADEGKSAAGSAPGATESVTQAEPTAGAETPTDATAAGGEARVIKLELTAALQILRDGEIVRDIPVTPGETIRFEIDNTAGFDHDFYIGTDEQLMVPGGTTDTGIPSWASGVQTLEWTVPDDITGLKYGCTVPGHYTLMQGTFSVSDAAATTTPPDASATTAPAQTTEPATAAGGEARVIKLELTAALQILRDGEIVRDIPVTPGETIRFEIDNTAGFDHDFYIGTDEQLMVPGGTTDTGIPSWASGVQTLEWTVPDDITGLKYGCTVPGHYTLMQGTFSVSA